MAESATSKAEKIRKRRELEEDVEQSQMSLAEATGSSTQQIRKRPITAPVTKYFRKESAAAVKYRPDSDLQRRAELEIAIYFVTANESFHKINTPQFRR